MTDFVLHVGLPKTATTTLQNEFFSAHSEIFYLGKYARRPVQRGCRSVAIHQALDLAIWNLAQPFDADRLRDGIGAGTWSEMAERKVILGSWEALGTMTESARFAEMLRRLARLFGRCRVMITVRNPYAWVPSLYLQELRGSFIQRNRIAMADRPFHELEDWLHGMDHRRDGNLLYSFGDNIREAVALFGKANVGVFLYEDLVADAKAYYAGLCDFIGVDLDECLALTSKKHLHPRITEGQLELMRKADASLVSRLAWRFAPRRNRARQFKGAANQAGADDGPVVIRLPESIRREIADRSRATHRWLAGEFGLDLERHGYPL